LTSHCLVELTGWPVNALQLWLACAVLRDDVMGTVLQ
jgi:hypothetical protein